MRPVYFFAGLETLIFLEECLIYPAACFHELIEDIACYYYEKLISEHRCLISFMPQKYKTNTKSKGKNKIKARPKPVSLVTRKSYWITLTIVTLVLTFAYGDLMKISLEKETLILGTILFLIVFAFYIGFKPYANYNKRATFIFVGASIIGFCIWVTVVLFFNATGIDSQIANSIGSSLFAVTSLMICLISGAFIGDFIGKNKERVGFFVNNKLRR
jgi:hypothetical protein